MSAYKTVPEKTKQKSNPEQNTAVIVTIHNCPSFPRITNKVNLFENILVSLSNGDVNQRQESTTNRSQEWIPQRGQVY